MGHAELLRIFRLKTNWSVKEIYRRRRRRVHAVYTERKSCTEMKRAQKVIRCFISGAGRRKDLIWVFACVYMKVDCILAKGGNDKA